MGVLSERAVTESFRHAAVFYDDGDDFVEMIAPFVTDGVRRGEPVLVAEPPERLGQLEAALGADAAAVSWLDMSELGANPARIIPAWREFVGAHPGRALRGVGEPAWPGRRPAELEECVLHEALLNVAFDGGPAFQLLCPYDAGRLPRGVLDNAMRTHPDIGGLHRDHAYAGQAHAHGQFGAPLPAPRDVASEIPFGGHDLTGLRGIVRRLCAGAGLAVGACDDMVLGVHELASNSIEHGGGSGVLRVWQDPDALVMEVADRGVIRDPMVGRAPSVGLTEGGRGIWMANQLCDLVQVRSGDAGTAVRLHSWL